MNKFILILMTLSIFSSCQSTAIKEETQLSDKVRQQAPADTPQQIAMRAADAFSNAPGLSAEQKLKLHGIYSRVYAESMSIRRELGQSKSLLFTTISNKDYKSADITKLKKNIINLDQRRLKIMFDALEDVQAVVGKGAEAEKIYKHLQDYELPARYENQSNF